MMSPTHSSKPPETHLRSHLRVMCPGCHEVHTIVYELLDKAAARNPPAPCPGCTKDLFSFVQREASADGSYARIEAIR